MQRSRLSIGHNILVADLLHVLAVAGPGAACPRAQCLLAVAPGNLIRSSPQHRLISGILGMPRTLFASLCPFGTGPGATVGKKMR
jgi:hypothetical protein